jgi:hypothetical protein
MKTTEEAADIETAKPVACYALLQRRTRLRRCGIELQRV